MMSYKQSLICYGGDRPDRGRNYKYYHNYFFKNGTQRISATTK